MSSKGSSGGCLKRLLYLVALIALVGYIGDKIDSQKAEGYSPSGVGSDTGVVTTVSEKLKNVPEELRENVYLDYIDGGYCEEFCGDVEINAIFVSDDSSKWDSATESTVKSDMTAEITRIKEAAASAGVSLDLSVRYHNADLSGQDVKAGVVTSNWKNSALNSAGIGDFSTAQITLEESRGVSSAPIVFIFNTSGRDTASHQPTGLIGTESINLYSNGIGSLFHEMCHLYGARDFYYPDDVDALAEKYLPDSIMNSGSTVDPLTAFIIGWTDTLSASAESFLRETSYITNKYLNEEHKEETFTGYGTRDYDGDVYTGNMVNGMPDGYGEMVFSDGKVYKGTWECGYGLVQGTMYYTDGATYTGSWKTGKYNGYGEMKYSDGDVYKGNWKDGKRDGYGTYIYNNGTKEEGYYSNNKGNGQFVIYYSNGTVFRGNKVDGQLSGYGETTYSDGGWYKGNWENGKRNGYGEMKYSDGSIYKGNWKDGKRHGYGTYTWASGSVRQGNWSNGEYVG